ncbi:MAG TPA: hypothetical protein VL551_28130 [Actinospica sp.]|jgi:hypothetical protein|nr:hypothetical protein [Actinospica sp.]
MTEIEIRPSTTGTTTSSEPTLTLSQVRALLADAAAYERAQRPIILHTPAQPLSAPHSAPQPVPVSVPAAPLSGPVRVSRLFLRSEVVGYSGISAGATAAVCGIASVFTTSPMVWGVGALAGMLVSFGGAVAANHGHDRLQRERGARARIGKDRHGCPVTEV